MDTGTFTPNAGMPCTGPGCAGTAPDLTSVTERVNPNFPTLQEIASINATNAYQWQREQQMKQQLENLDNKPLTDYTRERTSNATWTPRMDVWDMGNRAIDRHPTMQNPAMQNNVPAPVQQGGVPDASLEPITPETQPAPISAESLQYMNGFLRTQIGRAVQVEFLVGTNNMVTRSGILLGVGANYILLNETETDDILACDFYNIKFIRFYY